MIKEAITMHVTIIGTGRMARGISTRLLAGGNHVTLVGHKPGEAEALAEELKGTSKGGSISVGKVGKISGEVVFLAVPFGAVESIAKQYGEALAGKILVDITNPIVYQTMESIFPGSSGAEAIVKLIPESTRLVKAFNTTFAGTLLSGKVAGLPLDVFMAGDDVDAKAKITQLIEAGGLIAIDVGPLIRVRQLEAMGLLHIASQQLRNTGYMSAIKMVA
jgi:predicted dinucleotide-binding enzyme